MLKFTIKYVQIKCQIVCDRHHISMKCEHCLRTFVRLNAVEFYQIALCTVSTLFAPEPKNIVELMTPPFLWHLYRDRRIFSSSSIITFHLKLVSIAFICDLTSSRLYSGSKFRPVIYILCFFFLLIYL